MCNDIVCNGKYNHKIARIYVLITLRIYCKVENFSQDSLSLEKKKIFLGAILRMQLAVIDVHRYR